CQALRLRLSIPSCVPHRYVEEVAEASVFKTFAESIARERQRGSSKPYHSSLLDTSGSFSGSIGIDVSSFINTEMRPSGQISTRTTLAPPSRTPLTARLTSASVNLAFDINL